MKEDEGPRSIPVPLYEDVDPDCRIELRNKDGGIGLQVAECKGRAPAGRIAFINNEIQQADELLFSPLQYVDRALVCP